MHSPLWRYFVVLLVFCGGCTRVRSQETRTPLRDRELLSLVAGNALAENVVHEIESRGLSFRPAPSYRSQLTDAGADPHVLIALGKARIIAPSANAEDKSSPELLQHLAAAGKLMRNKQYQEAAEELNSALQSGAGPEAGFVMGELLRLQEQWPMAVSVYQQILQRNPDFPETQTKLSYVLYKSGDPKEALREAKAAMAQFPQNPEAHLYAGVALDELRKFDAAMVEYREALRLKPDYAVVHYDLGVSLSERGDKNAAIAEYRKALTLDPKHVNARYNLATELAEMGDFDSAIREFREAKRLDPERFDVRMNLGEAL